MDALPSGTIFVAATPSQGTCNGGVTCLLGDLGVGATATVRITVTVAGATTGSLVNVAQASSNNVDSNPANNRAAYTTTATAQAALFVSKVATPQPAVLGGQLVYRIVVTNTGPSAAQAVTVTDNLPAALLNPVVSSSQGGCIAFPCALGTIPAGGSATLLVIGTVAPTATADIVNTATVTSATSLDQCARRPDEHGHDDGHAVGRSGAEQAGLSRSCAGRHEPDLHADGHQSRAEPGCKRAGDRYAPLRHALLERRQLCRDRGWLWDRGVHDT